MALLAWGLHSGSLDLGTNCQELPIQYNSKEEAVYQIKGADFMIEEMTPMALRSWIRSARFYSCDGALGYLIAWTDRSEFVHQDVPIKVWRELKKNNSLDNYYKRNIRGKYPLKVLD